MLKIEKSKVHGIDTAIRGMRNPLESWDMSDSKHSGSGNYGIGNADRALMRKLVLAGTDHAKFMRMITVSCDIIAPQYFVAELDTYKIGTTRNSCSLQHKGASRPFSILDFSVDERLYEILIPQKVKADHKHANGLSGRTLHTDYIAWKNSSKKTKDVRRNIINEYKNGAIQKTIAEKYGISQSQVSEIIRGCGCANKTIFETAETWEMIISAINDAREMFLETGDYSYFIAMRQMIPMGYNYRFTWQANYAVLRNIYFARRTHKLTEWQTFCDWILSLPLSDIITAERSDT